MSSRSSALDGIVVLDLSTMLPGHFCTMILADLGARVITVERPGSGDFARHAGLPGSFESVNRNKESLTLDLKSAAGREVVRKLAAGADVLVEGFRPGAADRLGVGWAEMSAVNPRLVYCSISGYGQDGPYRDLPGHDPNYLAVAGVLSLAGDPEGPPSSYVGPSMADLSGAWFATISVLAALRAQERDGCGQYIDVALADTSFALVQNRLTENLVNNVGKNHMMARPASGLFESADGLYFTVAAIEDHFWRKLCQLIGADDWLGDDALTTTRERRARAAEIRKRLEGVFRTASRKDWLNQLRAADIPCAPAHDLRAATQDEHVLARGIVVQQPDEALGDIGVVRFPPLMSGTPAVIRTGAPALGAQTGAILAELGFTDADVERMRADGEI